MHRGRRRRPSRFPGVEWSALILRRARRLAFFAELFAARRDVWRVLRAWPGKEVAEVHDYVDMGVPVLAASVGKRARGYLSLGFPTHEERGGEEFVTGSSIPRRGRAVGRDGATAVAALHRRR